MPWLLKQKKKSKKKKQKTKKEVQIFHKEILQNWNYEIRWKVTKHSGGRRIVGKTDVYNNVRVNVDFVLNYCGFIFSFYFLLFIFRWPWKCWNLFAVCMSLHEPCLCVCERFKKGRWGSVTLVLKVKVYFRGRSCTWISLTLHRGGRTGGRKIRHKWLEFWQWHCGEMHWEKSTTVFTVKLSTRHLSFQRNLYIYV